MLKKIFDYFFGWELTYSTQSVEDYARFIGKLMDAGIKYRSNLVNQGDSHRGGLGQFTTYEVLVKKEDMYKLNEVSHFN
ncbi:MAG TPA: hypothetical protein DEF34_01715 [Desulfotomaculum sp.]|nr:hypothetical protein [Desulfotomaculum sp.]